MEDLETIPDDELDQLRRDTLAEQERRKKLEDGLNLIGQTVRDYLTAAGAEVTDDDETLGQAAINAVS